MSDQPLAKTGAVASTTSGRGGLPAGRLMRMIGKPRSEWTVSDMVKVVRDHGIRLVTLLHVGGEGGLKALDFAPRDEQHLRAVLTAGERADGSSIFRHMGIAMEASDILLRPRIASAFIDPFSPLPSLALMCSHFDRKGQPLDVSPDTIVRRGFERIREHTGIELHALGEVECFVGKRPAEGDIVGTDDLGYHATSPRVFGDKLRREALATLAVLGIGVKYGLSEVGYIGPNEAEGRIWEQHEIELSLAPLPEAADAVVLTRWVIANLAQRQGVLCNFDPIIIEGHAGSGLHFHFSPRKNGEHLGGRGDDGQLQPPARWLIGGLVQYGDALMAFGNRRPGSFIRLIQGKEAPNHVVWGEYDRKALVRLPALVRTESGEVVTPPTIEFRLPDGSAHPHLLLAGVAQAMVHGSELSQLDELLTRTSSTEGSKGRRTAASLPTNFEEVAEALESHREIFEQQDVFPSALIDRAIENLHRQHPGAHQAALWPPA